MQLTNTTDYAIRIICYLASKNQTIRTAELSRELKIPESYIPKITKELKKAGMVVASEGTHGGYTIAKKAKDISLKDVISCTESTMAISRCLEKDRYCSRNYSDCCKVHKILLDLQNTFNNRLENVMISDIIHPGKDEYFGRFYVILKVDLKNDSYECIYSHCKDVQEEHKEWKRYQQFLENYTNKFVYKNDQQKIKDFLSYDLLRKDLINGCREEDISYRRRTDLEEDLFVWMELKKYVDSDENVAILTLHNAKVIPNTMVEMEQRLRQNEKDVSKQYWDMVSLLVAVLNHNNLIETEHQDDISFYTKQVYLQLKENYPEYHITDEEIENVSHLAPIHDIGKIRVPIEILNKHGKLTEAEMELVKEHPYVGAEMTLCFPNSFTTKELNQYSYDICRWHHERYDGSGYPDGLKGEEIPVCAQVVGLVDAYDALINERPYKKRLKHETAIRMILNGECGAFSDKILTCFLAAVMRPEWKKKVRDLNEKEKEVHKTDRSNDLVCYTSDFTNEYNQCRNSAK